MCFNRTSRWWEEESREGRKDPVWDLFDRERHDEQPQPIAEDEHPERDRRKDREEAPVSIGA
jgi:hypothetical protein